MAEKGFGVKDINLIGASGTPTIESPNNLNLNAVNVAISTNASIGGNLTVTGTVGIAGTLTYEDVTNVDAIGIVTAREGIVIPDSKVLALGNRVSGSTLGDLRLYHNGNHSFIDEVGVGNLYIRNGSNNSIICQTNGYVRLYNNGNEKLATTSTGVSITGTLAATAVTGDGSGLTGIAVTEAPVTDYTISANGSSAYRIHGGGVDETANNPDLYLIRGQKYRFNNTTGSNHPFEIRVSNGGSAYTDGVSGDDEGVQLFTVPYAAPAKIFYQCTIHGGMVGNIYIRGAGGQNDNVGVTTFTGTVTTGDLTISDNNPTLTFNEGDGNPDYRIIGNNGTLAIQDIQDSYAQRFRIQSNGNIDIQKDLDVDGHTNLDNVSIAGVSTHTGLSQFANTINLTHASAGQNYIYFNEDLQFAKNGTGTRLKIDSSGRVLIGTNSSLDQYGSQSHLQVAGTSFDSSTIALRREENNANPPGIVFAKSRSGTLGGNTIVQDDDTIGSLIFTAADGNDLRTVGAQIKVEVDGAPAQDNIPGRIVFLTGGTAASNERLRITSDGKLLIGINASTSNDANLQVFKPSGNNSTFVVGNVATSASGLSRVDFCPSNSTVGARIECHATEDFSSVANRTADLVFVTRKDGTNSEKMRISSEGYVTKPNNPIFFAYMDSNTNHSSGDTLKLDHTELNVGSGYNTSNYRFTPPVNGHYMFHGSANLMLDNGDFTRSASVILRKNGTSLTYQIGRNSLTGYQASYPQVDGTFMVYGTTSDYFECRVEWETGGGNHSNLSTTETLHQHGTKFMGYLIG